MTEPINIVKDLKFPFVNKISDIIDPVMLEVILKGFNDVIKQGIVFISDINICNDDNFNDNRQFPSNEFMFPFACQECEDSMNEGKCFDIRLDELRKFKNNPTSSKLSFYLCENVYGLGLHMHFPVFTDDKFIGLLISGTGRFSAKISKDKAISFIDDLNEDNKESIESFLKDFEVIWFDKETISIKDMTLKSGIRLTYNDFILKVKNFEDTANKLILLLDSLYTGNIRKKNRDLISDILEQLYSVFGAKKVYGKQGYINNFDNVFTFIKERIFNNGNILLFDDFTHKNKNDMLGQTLPVVEKYSTKPKLLEFSSDSIDLLFNNLDLIDDSKVNLFWRPKDEFINLNIQAEIKEKRKAILNSLISYFDESLNKKSFLLLMPFNIYGKNKALIVLYDDRNIIPYGSRNLMFFFKRIYDIFKFTIHIYYNQIIKSNSIKMLIHDYRSRGGDIYAKTSYLLDHLFDKEMSKSFIRKELSLIKESSDSYVKGFDKLNSIGTSDYEEINSDKEENIEIFKDIINPLLQLNSRDKNIKRVYINYYNDIKYVKVYSNKRNLYLVFQNLFTNAIKYSFNNTTVFLELTSNENAHTVSISVNNLTYRLSDEDFNRIMNEQFRGEKAISYFDKLNKRLNLPKGEGLGLMSIKNIDDLYKWECKIEQLNASEYKYNYPAEINLDECSIFRATIKDISIKKKGAL